MFDLFLAYDINDQGVNPIHGILGHKFPILGMYVHLAMANKSRKRNYQFVSQKNICHIISA